MKWVARLERDGSHIDFNFKTWRERSLWNLSLGGRIILKGILNIVLYKWTYSHGLGYNRVEGSCEHSNELSCCIKGNIFWLVKSSVSESELCSMEIVMWRNFMMNLLKNETNFSREFGSYRKNKSYYNFGEEFLRTFRCFFEDLDVMDLDRS
jgi:hypothetical protein